MFEFLSRRYVERMLDEHISGRVNHRLLIWSLLCFEWWCRNFLERGPSHPPEAVVAARLGRT